MTPAFFADRDAEKKASQIIFTANPFSVKKLREESRA